MLHLKIKGLILDTIHHISVVDELINLRVTSIHDWEWQKRIRFESNALSYFVLIYEIKRSINSF